MHSFAYSDEKTGATRGVLVTKLSNYERYKIDRLYRENVGLFKLITKKMIEQYRAVPVEEIFSCMNIAFIKAARSYDPKKGKLGTILNQFARGEVSHYIVSSSYWGYSASPSLRELGLKARRLISYRNVPMFALPKILGCTKEQLREALEATLHIFYTLDDRASDNTDVDEIQEPALEVN
jgi:DNA-directed RNA polymerase specialized sigma subunit